MNRKNSEGGDLESTSQKSRLQNSRGFSLIELLVATAVLAMVLVLMTQVASGILGSTRAQNQQMDSVASARRALDAIEADLRKAVINDHATVLVGNSTAPRIAMLTMRRGPKTGPGEDTNHRFLAVRYETNTNNQIVRYYSSVPFSETGFLGIPATMTGTNSVLADGILAFQVRVATFSGFYSPTASPSANWATNQYNGVELPTNWRAVITDAPYFAANLTNRATGLRVWIAAADSKTMELLKSANQLSTARSILAAEDHAKDWRAAIDNSAIAPQAKSSIRILQKTIPLP